MRFIENSPVFHAQRVQTPILMLHNDNDDAVPWYQGIEFYLALRRLNKEVYMWVYNGEPQGSVRRGQQGSADDPPTKTPWAKSSSPVSMLRYNTGL